MDIWILHDGSTINRYMGSAGTRSSNIFLYSSKEEQCITKEVSFHIWICTSMYRHNFLLLLHLLEGATKPQQSDGSQVKSN